MGVTAQVISREGHIQRKVAVRGFPKGMRRELKLSFYDFIKWRKRNLDLFSE